MKRRFGKLFPSGMLTISIKVQTVSILSNILPANSHILYIKGKNPYFQIDYFSKHITTISQKYFIKHKTENFRKYEMHYSANIYAFGMSSKIEVPRDVRNSKGP